MTFSPDPVARDLGSGAGFDAFLCARKVGPTGRVIGVDMTPEMIEKARANARGFTNVEFRQGFIEDLPVADATTDVVILNCVVNLSPDKARVLRETFRVLKPGGRLRISDIATRRPLDAKTREDARAYVACLAGALLIDEYRALLEQAGFVDIEVVATARGGCESTDPIVQEAEKGGLDADDFVSVKVLARRPA